MAKEFHGCARPVHRLLCAVQPKHNIVLTREQAFADVTNQRGVAPYSLASIHPVYSGMNTQEQDGCDTPLINDFSGTSKCLFVCKLVLSGVGF